MYQKEYPVFREQKLVFILQPDVPHYRVPFFTKLKRLGQESNVIYVVGQEISETEKMKMNKFRSSLEVEAILARKSWIKNRAVLRHQIPRRLLEADLIIAEYALRNLIVFKWAYFGGVRRLALWGHGRTYTVANTRFEEWVKAKLANRCNWFFGYTKKGVDSVVAKGFNSQLTTVVQNSTDTKELRRLIAAVPQSMVDDFKLHNAIGDGPVAVFIGALDASKRLDFLTTSAIAIHQEIPNFELLIFGNGPELGGVLAICDEFSFIKYCGIADQNTQALISKVAKFIMMPGRVGLIAVDSFALGLPIVTTNWPWHAPEFEYLSNGTNSLVCENSLSEYSSGVINLIRDEMRLRQLRNNCLEDSKKYTIELMAMNFHKGVLKALNGIELKDN